MARVSLTDMRLAAILVSGMALFAMANANGAISNECLRGDSYDGMLVSHRMDCTKYYTCAGGEQVEKKCPIMDENGNRLHFNVQVGACDWPENVGCRLFQQTRPRVSSLVGKATIPTECPAIDSGDRSVLLAHETDCTKYYMCGNGEKYLKECPLIDNEGNRLYFNVIEQTCDWPQNVDCEQPESIVSAFSRKVEIPTECPAIDSGDHSVLLAHETDCTKYYMCGNGEKYLKECPLIDNEGNRLYFNVIEQTCDWPQNVDCEQPKSIVSAFAGKVEIPTECPAIDSGDHSIQIAHGTNCELYYMCSHGTKYLMYCPLMAADGRRLHFDPVLQVCDWPSNVNCKPGIVITTAAPTTAAPTTAAPTTAAPTTAAPTTAAPTTAAPTTAAPTTAAPTTAAPTTVRPELGCLSTCPNQDPPNKITALPHNECRKWCRCENREIKVFICPSDFHFSPTEKVCTTQEESGCEIKDFSSIFRATNQHDEALMNILGYNERFRF